MKSNASILEHTHTLRWDRSNDKVVQNSVRILIVDDIPQVRKSLATMLTLAGKNTAPHIDIIGEAQDGEEAIRQVKQLKPDLVLMDIEMPILGGFEATRRIKMTQPDIKVIILSIYASANERIQAQAAGADGFFEKSSALDGLIQAIQRTKMNNIDNDYLCHIP